MQKANIVKEIIKCGQDPVYFIDKYAKIQHPIKGLVPFKLYDFQKDLTASFTKNRFTIINKGRQLGVSTLIAAFSTWMILFYKDKNILVIATKAETAKNIINKVRIIIKNIPQDLFIAKITTDNKHSIELSNGSKIKSVSTSKDAGRSEALSLLIIDEAAHVDNLDELWTGLYPTLATGGRCILASTPNGTGNKFHKLYVDGETSSNDFSAVTLPWSVHPERDEEWFKNETHNLPRKKIAQEYEAEFIASGDTYIQPEDIQYLANTIRDPISKEGIDNNLWIWEYPIKNEEYIIGADIARGDGRDFSTLHCIKQSTFEVVAEYRGKLPPEVFAFLLNETGKKYNDALLAPESNSYGYTTIQKLRELSYPNLYVEGRRRNSFINTSMEVLVENNNIPGFETNVKTRPLVLAKFEELIRNKIFKSYSFRLVEELKTFRWKNGKQQADRGYNDDLVIAAAITCWLKETTGYVNTRDQEINIAMLDAMSVSSRAYADANGTGKEVNGGFYKNAQGSPILATGYNQSDFKIKTSNNEEIDFSWVIKSG